MFLTTKTPPQVTMLHGMVFGRNGVGPLRILDTSMIQSAVVGKKAPVGAKHRLLRITSLQIGGGNVVRSSRDIWFSDSALAMLGFNFTMMAYDVARENFLGTGYLGIVHLEVFR